MISEGASALLLIATPDSYILVYCQSTFNIKLLQLVSMTPLTTFIAKALESLREVPLVVYTTRTLIPDPGLFVPHTLVTRMTCMIALPFSGTFTEKPSLRSQS